MSLPSLANIVLTLTMVPQGALPGATPEGFIELQWQAPTKHVDGTPITGPLSYEVFETVPWHAPVTVPDVVRPTYAAANMVVGGLGTLFYTVSSIPEGQTVCFAIVAVEGVGSAAVSSNLSAQTCGTIVNGVLVPKPPTGVVAK